MLIENTEKRKLISKWLIGIFTACILIYLGAGHMNTVLNAIPFVCRPHIIDNVPYYNGALADTIPIEKAYQMGCSKVVLLLTLPLDTIRKPDKDIMLAKRIMKKYPLAADKLKNRAEQYNVGVALAKEYEAQGKLLIVAPDDTCGVSTLSRDVKALCRLYEKGYHDRENIFTFIYE